MPYFPFASSIKEEREEGDDEDVEEEEDEEPGEEEQDVPHSNDKKEPHPAGKLGYSLLEGQEDERDAPDASSSCSSDLSFGGSSSGMYSLSLLLFTCQVGIIY